MAGAVTGILCCIVLAGSAHIASAGDFDNCKEFNVIPKEKYDRNSSSAEDASKRPLGFVKASASYPGVVSNVVNPCAYLSNLTSKYIQVLVQPDSGSIMCVKDDGNPPMTLCSDGGDVSKCYAAHSNTVKFVFYCDTGNGCGSDVGFWYRLTPSEGDPDDWCLAQQNEYPSSLLQVPPVANKKTTPEPVNGAGMASGSFLLLVAAFLLAGRLAQ